MRSNETIWSVVKRRCTPKRRDAITPLRYFLINLNNPHAILLSGGQPHSSLDEASARHLEEAVAGHYLSTPNFGKADAADWLNLISSAVREFQNEGISISPTWVIPFAGPSPSPFNEISISEATQVHTWRASLQRWIINDAASASRAEFQAGVLLSSLLHGMLIDSVKIKRLLRHLCRNLEPELSLDAAFISFRLPFDGLGDHHLQRWQMDSITEMLYWRAIRLDGADLESAELYEMVKRILTRNGTNALPFPKQFSKLVKITATWWATRSCQTETLSSSRVIQAHAFREVAWNRLSAHPGPLSPQYIRALPNPNNHEEDGTSDDTLNHDQVRLLFPWFGEALSILEQETSTTDALAAISIVQRDANPENASTYLNWLTWLLQGKSSSGVSLGLSTIYQRFTATVTQLLATMNQDDDPAQLGTPALADIYAELTNDPMPGVSLSHLKEGLRDFHAFLVKTLNHPPLEREIEVLGNDASLKPVDGNIITFDDYVAIRALLKKRKTKRHVSDEEVEICQIVLMLAFKAGLRRMEIFGLRLSDFQDAPGLVLTISPHEYRGLKTTSSERVIPLRPFLNFEERCLLKRFVTARRRSEASSDRACDFLFRQFGQEKSESWISKMYTLIRNAIREHTNDDGLYMHHLRHSFASWTYLRLRTPDYPELAQAFSHLPETHRHLLNGRKLRLLLLYNDPSNTRRYGHVVARLLGHSSPIVSFNHYIHCCDLIAGSIASRESKAIEDQVLVAASGLPKSTAYENLAKNIQLLVRRTRQKNRQEQAAVNRQPGRRGAPRKEESAEIEKQWIPFQLQMDVLAILSKPDATSHSASDALQIPLELVDRIVESIKLRGSRFAVSDQDGKVRNPPRPPHTTQEQALFVALEARLKRLFACDRDLYEKGIEIHLSHVVLQKFDVRFRGKDEFQLLKRYLKFLKALDVLESQLMWVLRQKDTMDFPGWCDINRLPLIPTTSKRITPPKPEKAEFFADTIGVQMLAPDNNNGFGKHLVSNMLLASTMLS